MRYLPSHLPPKGTLYRHKQSSRADASSTFTNNPNIETLYVCTNFLQPRRRRNRMLAKFFRGGTGKGNSVVDYLTRTHDAKGILREPAPEIVKGDPTQIVKLIDSLDFKYKFNSGVISFAPEDNPTEEEQKKIISSFEKVSFPGLEPDQYDLLWVRHSHTSNGRIELHFVTPRVELSTGKSLNISPPGWQNYYCHWRDTWNLQQGWADPTDPARARSYQPGYQALRDAQDKRLQLAGLPTGKKKTDYRKLINNYITQQIELGNISNREDIIAHLEDADIKVTRQGKDYITITNDEIGQKLRLKGGIYQASWQLGEEPRTETRSRETENRADLQTRIKQAEEQLSQRIAKRFSFNTERYQSTPTQSQSLLQNELDNPSSQRYESLNSFLQRQLLDDALSSSPSPADSTTETDPRTTQEPKLASRTLPEQQQREISDSSSQLPRTDRLDLQRTTLHQTLNPTPTTNTNQKNERPRTRANEELIAIRQNLRSGQTAATTSTAAASQTSSELEQQRRRIDRQSSQLDGASRKLRRVKMKRTEELEQFKTQIDLVQYAQNLGYQPDPKKSSTNCIVLKHQDGDKILVGIDQSDRHYFYYSLTDNNDSGSIIDFVQKRQNLNLGQVRKELRPWLPNSHQTISKLIRKVNSKPPQQTTPKLTPTTKDRAKILAQFNSYQTITNHPYLQQRKINSDTLNNPRFKDTIYQDQNQHQNLIFPHQDRDGISGFEIRNTGFKGFSSGGEKALWCSKSGANDRRLVICESPIDCLSYHQLFPDNRTRYLATSGTLSNKQKTLIQSAFEKIHSAGGEIIIATDGDAAGKKIAQELNEIAPKTAQISLHVPKYQKDWNDALKAQIRQEAISQQQQRDLGRGFSR